MARSPLSETIQRVQGMIDYVRENLSEDEYALFLDLVAPEPEAETVAVKKSRKKRSSKKSARASLQQQIQSSTRPLDGGVSKMRCAVEGCAEYADNPIHNPQGGYAGWHDFDPSTAQAAAATGD